jgi:hypothetical protein
LKPVLLLRFIVEALSDETCSGALSFISCQLRFFYLFAGERATPLWEAGSRIQKFQYFFADGLERDAHVREHLGPEAVVFS